MNSQVEVSRLGIFAIVTMTFLRDTKLFFVLCIKHANDTDWWTVWNALGTLGILAIQEKNSCLLNEIFKESEVICGSFLTNNQGAQPIFQLADIILPVFIISEYKFNPTSLTLDRTQ